MSGRERLALAINSMTPEQRWALRVTIAAERKVRLMLPSSPPPVNILRDAITWAAETVQ